MVEKLQIKRQRQKFQGYREYIDKNTPLEMVLIPDGTFTMGASEKEEESRSNERPQHNVTISSFLMGRYPITQAQWRAIASRTDLKVKEYLDPDPSHFKEDPPQPPLKSGEKPKTRWDRPVESVNWYQAVEFCQRLSKLTKKSYRLPSEAEWEYACRGVREPLNLEQGESYPPFHFGETITTDLANYRGKDNEEYNWSGSYGRGTKVEYREETTPVGYFKVVNAFGLSDMHGNVCEWCLDDWHDDYENAPTDGSARFKVSSDDGSSNTSENIKSPSEDDLSRDNRKMYNTVLRGGSWVDDPNNCRSAFRYNNCARGNDDSSGGLRVVCELGRTL